MLLKFTLTVLTLAAGIERAVSWGGRFNRFSPEMLSNMGYGGYGNNRHAPQRFLPVASSMDLLETLLQSEEDEEITETSNANNKGLGGITTGIIGACSGRRCSANEHCCPGTVCVDLVDGPTSVGTCLSHHGQQEGAPCNRATDCDVGLICATTESRKSCQQPNESKKQYNDECGQSNECDALKGLCCQLLRRHRQSPRKACSYFRDPLVCIGAVAVENLKEQIHHTANEKRLTGRAFALSNRE